MSERDFSDAEIERIEDIIWENCYGVDAVALARKIIEALRGAGDE